MSALARPPGPLLPGILAATLLAAPDARAAVGVEPELTLGTRYLWRGFALEDGPVAQPGLTLYPGDSGVYVGVWGNLALARGPERAPYDEVDPYLGWFGEGTLGDALPWSLDACLFAYSSPQFLADTTAELQLTFSLDHLLGPEVLLAQDLRWWGSGTYLRVGLTPTVALGAEERTTLGAGGHVGSSTYRGPPDLQDLGATVVLTQALGPVVLTLDGRLQWSPDCTDPGQLCAGGRLQALGSW